MADRVVRPWPVRVVQAPLHPRTWIEDKEAIRKILQSSYNARKREIGSSEL